MAINIRDENLERRIEAEQTRRSDATTAKTARTLLTERLQDIETAIKQNGNPANLNPSSASA